jgi:hypothetical protein
MQSSVAMAQLRSNASKSIGSVTSEENASGVERRRKVGRSHMVQFLDKHLLARANTALLLTLVWGGLAACAIAAAVYDVSHWITRW